MLLEYLPKSSVIELLQKNKQFLIMITLYLHMCI